MVFLSSFDAFNRFAELVVDALEHILVVDVDLGRFTQDFLLYPILVQNDFLSVEVTDVGVDAAHLRPLVELHGQADNLADVALSFCLRFLGHP